jgi:hypothetical protein
MTESSTAFNPPACEPRGPCDGSTFQRVLAALATASLLALGGCASAPNPTGEMATARAAVDNARRAGAGQLAEAEMAEAQDRITFAERAHAAKEYESARRAAEQARAAAELAEEKARLAKARQAKTELDNTLKALRGGTAARPVQ